MPPDSSSDTFLWIGPTGGLWTTPADWSDLTTGDDPSTVAPGAGATVTIDGPSSGAALSIGGTGVAATIDMSGLVDLSGAVTTTALDLTASGAALTVDGTMSVVSLGAVDATDTITTTPGAILTFTDPGPITASLMVDGGSSIRLPANVTLSGGTLEELPSNSPGAIYIGGVDPGAIGLIINAGATVSGSGTLEAGYDFTGNSLVVDDLVQIVGTIDAQNITVLGGIQGSGVVNVEPGGFFSGSVDLGTQAPTSITFNIGDGATAELPAGVGAGNTIDFTGVGGIVEFVQDIQIPPIFPTNSIIDAGTIENFVQGDRLIGIINRAGGVTSPTFVQNGATGTLTIGSGDGSGNPAMSFVLQGTYSTSQFLLTVLPASGSIAGVNALVGQIDLLPSQTFALSAGSGVGDSFNYVGPSGGAYGDAANWFDVTKGAAASVAPGAGDAATITGSSGFAFTVLTQVGAAGVLSINENVAINGVITAGTVSEAGAGANLQVDNGGVLNATTLNLTGASALLEAFGDTPNGPAGFVDVNGMATIGAGDQLAASGGGRIQVGGLTLEGGLSNLNTIAIGQNSAITIGTADDAPDFFVKIDAGFTLTDLSPASAPTRIGAGVIDDGMLTATNLTANGLGGDGVVVVEPGGTFDTGILQAGEAVTFTVDAGGVLNLDLAAQLTAGSITFEGAGDSLSIFGNGVLPDPFVLTPTLGFAPGDSVELEVPGGLTAVYTQSGPAVGTVAVLDPSGATIGALALDGDYAGDRFVVTNDTTFSVNIALAEPGSFALSTDATGDAFTYTGLTGGAWGDASNWADTTNSTHHAAPGAGDIVTIVGGASNGLTVLTGSGDSASLTYSQNVAVAGAFATGTLVVGTGLSDNDPNNLFIDAGGTLDAASMSLTSLWLPTVVVNGPGASLDVTGALAGFVLGEEFPGLGGFTVENGGSLSIGGYALTDAGFDGSNVPFVVSNGSTLVLPTSLPSIVSIALSGTDNALKFDTPSAVSLSVQSAISGFAATDLMFVTFATLVTGVSFTQTTSAAGTLDLLNASDQVAGTLTLNGNYTGDTFYSVSLSPTTTEISLSPLSAPSAPVVTAPASEVIGQGQATAISGVSLAESGAAAGETFTVTLTDTAGLLSAAGAGVIGSGTTSLTIAGSLAQVNTDLATLSDTDATLAPDTIHLAATDGLGASASPTSIAVTVTGLSAPVITAPASETIGQGQATAIAGVSLAESGAGAGETFTVTLTDTAGLLSATGSGVSGSGTTSLTITGSLAQVNADLASLSDTDATVGPDTVHLAATDSLGASASPASIAVTVPSAPVITAPASETIGLSQATAISGVSLAESGAGAGETFTVTLTDTAGLLSATGSGVSGSGTTSLTITGSLAQVNADLASLSDTDATVGPDTVHLAATDSLGASASPASIAVTVPSAPVITAPASETIGLSQATAISGVSLAETGAAAGETFTVTLTDAASLLSATGSGVSGSGTTSLTIAGSLAQVNTDLATLSDIDGTVGPDTIHLAATDSLGASASPASIAVTVPSAPVITAPASETIGLSQATAISGVSLAETGAAAGETFTVTLTDAASLLSATGSGVSGSGTTSLTIAGSLAQVNTDLATLSDIDGTVGPDTIHLAATDSLGVSATLASIAVTVPSAPVITAPASETIGLSQATAISGVSLAETGAAAGEIFTVTLTDTAGLLSATGTGVSGSGTTSLTVTGSLAQVNTDLATLSDTDATLSPDTIHLAASDNLGGAAAPISIAVTVTAPAAPVITAPATETIGLSQATAIAGVSLAESGAVAGETFTVTLTDTAGLLSATGTGVSGSGTTSLTVTGSLAQVNTDLATLSDTDATLSPDTIHLAASDNLGGAAAPVSIAVTVTAPAAPVITAPATETIGLSQATAIAGVSLAESGAVAGETFTVTLTDTAGLLSATGTGVSGSGTTSLTIAGSLAQVNTDLATLSDTDATLAPDTIHLTASDSLGGAGAPVSIAVTVTAPSAPVITAPASVALGQDQATLISGVSLAESGAVAGETFTVTLTDTAGLLSAMGPGVSGSGTTSLTIAGSLAQVNTDLATLSDTDATVAPDTIHLTASDSLGGAAAPASIAVTVTAQHQNPPPVIHAPVSATVDLGQASAIAGVSLTESGAAAGETFTVTLTDTAGLLSATGAGVSGSGTTNLTITGSLTQVNTDLATLSDTDATGGPDTILLAAADSLGGAAVPRDIAVNSSSLQALETYYSDVTRLTFAEIPAADFATLSTLASYVDAGTLTLAAADISVAGLAADTTSLSNLTYQFFTGLTPTEAGLAYLISPEGGDPNNLDSAYYHTFNLQNRFINFSVNLGEFGQGAAQFSAAYGALSLSDSLAKAYTQIFGFAPDAAKVSAILTGLVPDGLGGTETREQYFAYYGRDGLDGIGTKVAMIGWLLSVAVTDDIGVYAKAEDAFLADLGPDGIAHFNTNLVASYGPQPTGAPGATIAFNPDQSVSLTAANPALQSTNADDTVTGASGLDAGQSVVDGDGNDIITVAGTVYGLIQAGNGDDTVTLGSLGATPATAGVAAQFGTVALGGGDDTVYLIGAMAPGTSLTATGPDNTLYLSETSAAALQGAISGFQTIYVLAPLADQVVGTGPQTVYDVVGPGFAPDTQVGLLVSNGGIVVLQDTSYGVAISYPNGPTATAEVHLDNFTGAPTTSVAAGAGPGGVYQANGGSITVAGVTGTLLLHVDGNSTAGMIYAYDQAPDAPISNLTIQGTGSLTAQVSSSFTHVDASAAANLVLTYADPTESLTGPQSSGVFLLSSETDTLNVQLADTSPLTSESMAMKFVFGLGVDTFVVTGPSLSNLGMTGQTVNAPSEIDGFKVGIDHVNLDAVSTTMAPSVQAYVQGAASLTQALTQVSAHTGAADTAVFTYNGDTYIYQQDSTPGLNTGDGLIMLVGVTGLSVVTGAATGDIHYG